MSTPIRQLVTAREMARAAGRRPAHITVLVDEANVVLGNRPSAEDHTELLRRCSRAGRSPGIAPASGESHPRAGG